VNVTHYGLILFTENYQACLEFYTRVLGLSVWYEKAELTCLRFGPVYLMVEHGGVAAAGEKPRSMSPVVLRLNVSDIEQACAELRARGVAGAQVTHFPWGKIVHFLDPDGNSVQLCEWPEGAVPHWDVT
jgi:lactoylglutathione lyase